MIPEQLDPALLSRIRGGDRDAFALFFRAWYPRLADHACRILGQPDAAEDAVQEVFVALWQGRERLPEPAKLTAYLLRAVRNRALNQARGAGAANRNMPLDDSSAVVQPAAFEAMEEADLATALASAMDALPPRTREVFLLSREEGLTYAEIAELLEISVKTVETLMGRGLRVLRERLRRSREA